jgi:DNA topoisomerase IB
MTKTLLLAMIVFESTRLFSALLWQLVFVQDPREIRRLTRRLTALQLLLESDHIVKENNDVYLSFVGKKGVSLKIPIDDTVLANKLLQRAEAAGPDGQLFPNVTDKSLRDYTADLTKHGAKPKDFRTLLGTSLANELVQSMPKPTSQSAYKKAVMEVAKRVSELGKS